MKKIILSILSLIIIFSAASVVASSYLLPQNQSDVIISENTDKEEPICEKTGKVCKKTCEKKATNSCCQSKKNSSCSKSEKKSSCCKSKNKSSCSKSSNKGFDFNKSNNYGEKKSCSKKENKKCCKKKTINEVKEVSNEKESIEEVIEE